jgi:CheY-like chemotaxis protein
MHSISTPSRPQALVIEDFPRHADVARFHLENVGFEVIVAENLMQASLYVRDMLDPRRHPQPTLLLVDFKGVQPDHPELEGPNWVAVIVREMQQHLLYPAVIVAISGELTQERTTEARVAGCHERVLIKPICDKDALWLRSLVMQPATIPHADASPWERSMIQAFQTASARSLQKIFENSVSWTPNDAYLLLRRLTPYPSRKTAFVQNDERAETLVRVLGGPNAARQMLQNIAEHMKSRSAVHAEILIKFLEGWERREIVKDFVLRGLYDDSHIYNCIKELPSRIYERLKAHQHTV